jgi:hypothetical protein
MRGHAVVRAGGQTGMMPAAALAGTDVAIVERRASPEAPRSRTATRRPGKGTRDLDGPIYEITARSEASRAGLQR